MKVLIGLLIGLLVAAGGVLLFALSGTFNVAATTPDNWITRWLFHTTMRRSVIMRSADLAAPKFTDEEVKSGFKEFNAMCTGCHGAPGKPARAVGKGLSPRPPDLAEAARAWDDGNLFWIIKNGVKMTGMPAFGRTHDDPTIWNIVAFVKKLPGMTAEQYQGLQDQAGSTEDHEHEHEQHH